MASLTVDIPILTYHQLTVGKNLDKYTTSIQNFKNHLGYLRDSGFQSISLRDYVHSLSAPDFPIPENSCLLTFDDGHISDFELALPALAQYGFVATFFVTTGWINKTGYMNSNQLRGLAASGMEVCCHGDEHVRLESLTVDALRQELAKPKKMLEDVLGIEVDFLSFPGGGFNGKVVESARRLGYKAAMCSIPFYLEQGSDFWTIGRHMVTNGEIRDFKNYLEVTCRFRFVTRLKSGGKDFLRRWEKKSGKR